MDDFGQQALLAAFDAPEGRNVVSTLNGGEEVDILNLLTFDDDTVTKTASVQPLDPQQKQLEDLLKSLETPTTAPRFELPTGTRSPFPQGFSLPQLNDPSALFFRGGPINEVLARSMGNPLFQAARALGNRLPQLPEFPSLPGFAIGEPGVQFGQRFGISEPGGNRFAIGEPGVQLGSRFNIPDPRIPFGPRFDTRNQFPPINPAFFNPESSFAGFGRLPFPGNFPPPNLPTGLIGGPASSLVQNFRRQFANGPMSV